MSEATSLIEPLPQRGCVFWVQKFCSFPVALAAVLGAIAFGIGRRGLADPDIWWHLRNAEYLLRTGQWIRADSYSYTVAGHSWLNPEWLAEIPYYIAWRWFGLVGIKALSLLLLETIFSCLLYVCWRKSRNIKASAVACWLAVLLGTVSFGPRTILFGYIYLVLLLMVLEEFRSRGRGFLWVLPPLFCLWVNSHGSWFLGMIVFVIFTAAGTVEGRWRAVEATKWSASQLRQLAAAGTASFLALFVNPYGYRLILYPFDMAFRQKLNIAHVAEWVSVDFHDARGKVALLLLAVLLAGALLSTYRWRLEELAMVLFGMYAGLTYIRFLFLAGILAAPVIANLFGFLPPYRREIDKPVVNALLIAASLAFVWIGFPSSARLRGSVEREYPADVLPYLASHPPSGPVLNYYLWGGYLGWNDPGFKDFVDSRVDIFEYAGVFGDYLDLLDLNDAAAVLEKYHIRYVLFPVHDPLTYLLQHDPGWQVVFRGDVSILFEKAPSLAASAKPSSPERGH